MKLCSLCKLHKKIKHLKIEIIDYIELSYKFIVQSVSRMNMMDMWFVQLYLELGLHIRCGWSTCQYSLHTKYEALTPNINRRTRYCVFSILLIFTWEPLSSLDRFRLVDWDLEDYRSGILLDFPDLRWSLKSHISELRRS